MTGTASGYDEMLLAVDGGKAARIDRTGLADHALHERAHLQEWILAHPEILGPQVVVVTSEFGQWQTARGAPVLDRPDIIGLDPDGRLVVAELKRGEAPTTVHMQAINYAAMASRLRPEDVAELFAATETARGNELAPVEALTALATERLLTAETVRNPRIVLVASDYPPSVTASVVWLNEQGVDITLVRFRTYKVDEQLVVSFSRLFPVPDVEDFTIGRRRESEKEVVSNRPGGPWDAEGLRRLAEQGNPVTLAMLDLCSRPDAAPVTYEDIAGEARASRESVRSQLAGLTMRLRNQKKYGFSQRAWPVDLQRLPGGIFGYSMTPELASAWRSIRSASDDKAPGQATTSGSADLA